jgi:Zn-dependent M28 family amino/carboxypeptidase
MNQALARRVLIAVSAVVVAVLAVVLVTRGPGGPPTGTGGTGPATTGTPGGAQAAGAELSQRLRDAVGAPGISRHLAELNRIAAANGGNRAAGSPGYDASAAYVMDQLSAAGYSPRTQSFEVQAFGATARPVLAVAGGGGNGQEALRNGADFSLLQYSGSGEVTARVAAVDLRIPPDGGSRTSGCEQADFDGFPRGAVALLQRGSCLLRAKVENAQRAGAAAALVMNEGTAGNLGVISGTLGSPSGIHVPALALSYAVGERLARLAAGGASVRVSTSTGVATRRTVNVIAETRGGSPDHVVMVGAHLDSVPAGPGVNDNGSGSALVLELARALAAGPPTANRVRFAWWGAEEIGLVGSTEYARTLSAGDARRIAAYLNFDMIGSPNYTRYVYGADRLPAGSAAIQRVFDDWFASQGLTTEEIDISGRSDHGPFADRGIPVGGLFSGADNGLPASSGRPGDPCYHQACDNAGNVSQRAIDELSDGAAHAVATLAASTAEVDAARGG